MIYMITEQNVVNGDIVYASVPQKGLSSNQAKCMSIFMYLQYLDRLAQFSSKVV